MTSHVLDRPVWDALATRHSRFAVGGARARRFADDMGPLAGTRDDEPESLAALAELVPADGTLLVVQRRRACHYPHSNASRGSAHRGHLQPAATLSASGNAWPHVNRREPSSTAHHSPRVLRL
jgi:hypothetical protein